MGIFRKLFRKRKNYDKELCLPGDREAITMGQQYSMASWERLYSNVQAVRYLVETGIPGDIVECGVWRGGSMMVMIQTLQNVGDKSRELFLYDTFEGMSRPVAQDGNFALEKFEELKTGNDQSDWCRAGIEEVRSNLSQCQYDVEKLHFVSGKVEDTIPATLPGKIALLRLDMDWYEPTVHAMKHLFPLLEHGGVLVIDDYGHWEGCRKAIDECLREFGVSMFLNRIDYTGRIGIKP